MKLFRRTWRIVRLLAHVGRGLVLAALVLGRREQSPDRAADVVAHWLEGTARIFGLRIRVQGRPVDEPALCVANHISWLDVCVLGGLLRGHFLAKAEVRDWPVIGWLSARAGTLYITRGGRGAWEQALEQLAFELRRGNKVILFPEGTTTDGRGLRRFLPRLFAAAQLAKVSVQPIALAYPYTGPGQPPAPFIGEDTLARHAWTMLGEKSTDVEVHVLPALTGDAADRRALAIAAHRAIAACLGFPGQPERRQG